jgi:perosamine synthetase
MSFYRDEFGYGEGAFPHCEEVAGRSLALPFFTTMSEDQVARVAEGLGRALRERRG